MKRVAFDHGRTERRILVAMIVNKAVISEIAAKWSLRGRYCFRSEYSRTIGNWAVEHFQKYKEPIGHYIKHHFERWTQTAAPSEVQGIERYLETLYQELHRLREEGPLNANLIFALAEEHFNLTYLRHVRDELETAIEDNDWARAEEAVTEYNPVGLGRSEATIVTFDEAQRESMLRREIDNDNVLIRYPQALGQFFGQDLARGNFFVFLAGEKVGKTMWMLDLAVRSWQAGNKTVYFTIGDMNKTAILRRLLTRLIQHPPNPGCIEIPRGFDFENGNPDHFFLEKVLKEFGPRTEQLVQERVQRVMRKYGRLKSHRIKIVEFPASSFTYQDLAAQLQRWKDRGYEPDVVCLDYADLMALPPNTDVRNGTHLNWMKLRGLNQEYNYLFVTATQANALSYKTHLLTAASFSEDKRKNAHPTGIVGINQTAAEKEHGVYRLNWIMRREDEFNVYRCCHVASCMRLNSPCMRSAFPKVREMEAPAVGQNSE